MDRDRGQLEFFESVGRLVAVDPDTYRCKQLGSVVGIYQITDFVAGWPARVMYWLFYGDILDRVGVVSTAVRNESIRLCRRRRTRFTTGATGSGIDTGGRTTASIKCVWDFFFIGVLQLCNTSTRHSEGVYQHSLLLSQPHYVESHLRPARGI